MGKNLRLHPAFVVMGVYDEPVEGWRGQIQSAVSITSPTSRTAVAS